MGRLFLPDDWTAMRAAVRDVFSTELGSTVPVIWAKQQQGELKQPAPAPSSTYVSLKLLVPPVPTSRAELRSSGVAIQVSDVQNATAYAVTVGGSTPTITSGNPATASAIRDALIAAIGALGTVAASAIAPDTLNLDPIDGVPFPAIAAGTHMKQRIAERVLMDAVATFSVDIYAVDGTSPSISQRLQLALEKPSARGRLSDGGWGLVSIEGVRGPDEFAGSQWIDRAGFDLRLACRTQAIDLLQYVEHAAISDGTFAG